MTVEQAEAPQADQRPVRMCDVCGGVDDHPRHVFAHAPGDGETNNDVAAAALAAAGADSAAIIGHIRDNTTTMRHMDCCRDAGCPDGTCNEVTQGAEQLRGPDLVNHLTQQQPIDQPTEG